MIYKDLHLMLFMVH